MLFVIMPTIGRKATYKEILFYTTGFCAISLFVLLSSSSFLSIWHSVVIWYIL